MTLEFGITYNIRSINTNLHFKLNGNVFFFLNDIPSVYHNVILVTNISNTQR